MSDTTCIGFAECPCSKCRASRLAATAAHPHHAQGTGAYCGVCRTIDHQFHATPAQGTLTPVLSRAN